MTHHFGQQPKICPKAPKHGRNIKVKFFFHQNKESGVTGVADYEIDIHFSENKMADLIWQTYLQHFLYILANCQTFVQKPKNMAEI